MGQKTGFLKIALALAALGIIFLFPTAIAPAQSDPEPRTVHNACLGSCVVDVNFLHSGMGDTMAKNAYHGWFDSYYTLTGCGDPGWKTDLLFLLDVIGDSVGAPGAPTLQCWQGLMAQAAGCSDACSDYFIPDAKYAPNVRLTLDGGEPGYLEVTLDNQANLGGLPELEPNAYSRRFPLRATLQLGDGTPVLVADSQMPSLSFPNWITRGGYSDCLTAYGADDPRCTLIEGLVTPAVVSTSLEFLDGVFYDLSGQVADLSDAAGSFPQDGYVRLLSNGDRLTVSQGDFAGFLWVKTHNLSTGAHTQQLIPWDARGSALTVVNHECNSWLSTCWLTGERTETDTYVFALQGPAEKRIPGAYTVTVTADIPHEKDFADNRASYTYAAEAGEQEEEAGDDGYPQEAEIGLEDLPVIDLPGPGTYPNTLSEGVPGVMYRLRVPEGIHFLFVRLVSLDGGQFSYFVRRGAVPVPDYPLIHDDYHCWQQSDASYAGGCPFPAPAPGDYYIFISYTQGTAFQLEVEWTTSAEAATRVAQLTQEATTQPEQEQDDPGGLLSEVEPNDSRAAANPWDLGGPFTGQIARTGDRDYVFLNITHPGIYTFSLAEVGADLRPKLALVRASTGNSLASSTAPTKGQGASLSFDASAGEQYHLIVSAAAFTSGAPAQPYTLSLSGFIPDPHEPNDDLAAATRWDLAQGPLQGYFWDKTTGRADYYRFSAPPTLDGGPLRFELSNPSPTLRIRLTLLRANGIFLANTPYSAPGQPAALSRSLPAGQEFFLKLETLDVKTSPLPYTLSAAYEPAGPPDEPVQGGRPLRLRGLVIERGGLLPAPVREVEIYAQVGDGPAVLLATTGVLGTYSAPVSAAEGQSVRIWALKPGLTFTPAEDTWQPDPRARSHRTVFSAAGAQLIQATLTPTPDNPATLPPPPLIQTALSTLPPRPTSAVTAALTLSPAATATTAAVTGAPPLPTPSPALPSPTPPGAEAGVLITGSAWRLFPASPPAGVGGARVILSVNGVEQPAALSRIDGSYELQAPGVRPGDRLALRAENPGDDFAPSVYTWQAEAGVPAWTFDFYSAWGTIPSPASDDQNHLSGRVTGAQGQGLAGVYVIVQMGTSDALQRLGPTDADGYYSGSVRLPDWLMVTVWADPPGCLPARVQFFHAYAPEERQIDFWQR